MQTLPRFKSVYWQCRNVMSRFSKRTFWLLTFSLPNPKHIHLQHQLKLSFAEIGRNHSSTTLFSMVVEIKNRINEASSSHQTIFGTYCVSTHYDIEIPKNPSWLQVANTSTHQINSSCADYYIQISFFSALKWLVFLIMNLLIHFFLKEISVYFLNDWSCVCK